MSRGAIVQIDLAALQHNLRRVRAVAPGKRVLAMVKSDGYGHGLIEVAKALYEADAFGVAAIEEAVQLREAGVTQSIVVMSGFYDPDEIKALSHYQLTPVIHHAQQIAALEAARLDQPLPAWLKFDTGMHRLGFLPETVEAAWKRLSHCPAIAPSPVLMTHLACADLPNDPFTQHQIQTFFRWARPKDAPMSIVNSAGILAYPEAHADWVRPGIMLYGVSPFAERTGEDEGLKPAMSLGAKLMAIKWLNPGDAVGYGVQYHCPEKMPVGIVGIGYGDGYPRHAKTGTPTLVGGKVCPLVGRVSMDMCAIDLRMAPHAQVGDAVLLWGAGLPIEKIAPFCDTISYELLCNIAPRVTRHVVTGASHHG